MPYVFTNGIRLSYERWGRGERVLLIMGSSAGGRAWTLHQTPALVQAGYQAVTFDNRGISPSDVPPGRYSLSDMVADTKGLIESLAAAPCRIVGVSLGAMIAQELAIRWPELVRCAVLIATKSRTDAARQAHSAAFQAVAESGVTLPPRFEAAMSAFQMLSPKSLNDDQTASLWLETFELFSNDKKTSTGQLWADEMPDRREALRGVTAPCRVIAFSDDLVTPPHLGAEVAEAIPDCDYVEIESCGHYGYLERPAEVNSAILEFLAKN
ncbi:alpha/beta hydrolase [Streptosporangium subroseum]|uniref:alpha/beta fold hydrolase n=1 Tax=Streptosporangium subroseum TaxID=106412 RepID=UPI003429E91E